MGTVGTALMRSRMHPLLTDKSLKQGHYASCIEPKYGYIFFGRKESMRHPPPPPARFDSNHREFVP